MTTTLSRPDWRRLAQGFAEALAERVYEPLQLMEVCGTHSQAIARFGIKALLPPAVTLLSGPGCPVCVTAPGEIEALLALARRKDVTLCTFGDMMRVPGSTVVEVDGTGSTLAREKALGADVQVIYSPLQALEYALAHPGRETVLVGVGFETTAPAVAATIRAARQQGIRNLSVLVLHKLVPPALEALLVSGEVPLGGLLCPGHVSTIIGTRAYEPLAARYRLPCVIAGFEPSDLLAAMLRLVEQARDGVARVENVYGRSVRPEGNPQALALMDDVFAPTDANWRGLGTIPQSGLGLREEYREFDAARRHEVAVPVAPEPVGCCCGAVLRGALSPRQCPSFGARCTTERPLGPCMVSSEGSCAAAWRYGELLAAGGGVGL